MHQVNVARPAHEDEGEAAARNTRMFCKLASRLQMAGRLIARLPTFEYSQRCCFLLILFCSRNPR